MFKSALQRKYQFFIYTSGIKIYQFKVKDSKIKPYSLCLSNTAKDFTVDNMKKQKKQKTKLD